MLSADLAGPEDEAELRRLMAETPMAGRVTLAFAREPDYFAATHGACAHVIVIRDAARRRIASFGEITTRDLYLDGRLARVGYLSSWRVGREWRGQPQLFDMGIERLAELQKDLHAEVFYSAIAEDNVPARKRLEARRGLGAFQPIDRLETSLFAAGFRRPLDAARADPAAAAALRAECLPQYQFAAPDLPPAAEDHALDGACAGIWDQRGERQVVVRDYDPALRRLRPAWNALARLSGRPRLPPRGTILPLGLVSALAVPGSDPARATRLLAALRGAPARALGLGLLSLTLSRRHPLATAALPLKPWRWGTQLYIVTLPGCRTAADLDPARPAQPEAGLM